MMHSVDMWLCILVLVCTQCLLATCQLQFVPWTKLEPAKLTSTVHAHEPFSWVSEKLFNNSVETAWKLFKIAYKKGLLSESEDQQRFHIFRKNYRMILEHNEKYEMGLTTYRMDVNEYADKTRDELRYLRGLTLPVGGLISRPRYKLDSRTPPDSIDWRQKGAVTAVKNQGNCGSCWAFSTTGSMEGHYYIKHKKLYSFSEQQLVDCSSRDGNNACNGGLMDFAFTYVEEAGGIETEECYPYVSGETGEQNPHCSLNRTCIVARVSGFVDVEKEDEVALQHAVGLEGPVSIAINAGLPSFSFYSSGVYEDNQCTGDESSLDHGVLAVGYGHENGVPYWLVKNSWGPRWGEEGYVKIRRNKHNMCGVATAASYPRME